MSELVAEPKSQNALVVPPLYDKENDCTQASLQGSTIQLWDVLLEKDTAQTYQKAGSRTLLILKRVFQVVYLLITSSVAIILWLCGIGFRSGYQFRHWIVTEEPSVSEIVGLVLEVLLWPLKYAVQWADNFVKDHFGWEVTVAPAQVGPAQDDVKEATEPST